MRRLTFKKKQRYIRMTAVLLISALLAGTVISARNCSADTGTEEKNGSYQAAMEADRQMASEAKTKEGSVLACEKCLIAGSPVCDWLAIAFSAAGIPEAYDTYLSRLEEYVTLCYAETGGISDVIATDYHRITLAVLALGGDPESFGTGPDGGKINLVRDGIWEFEAGLDKQGINGLLYALIVLDSGGYEVPEGNDCNRPDLIRRILELQEPDGGFGLMKGSSEVDLTAMTLTALAPYAEQHPQEIEAALGYLAGELGDDGHYRSYGEKNAESAAQVVIALTSLGIDPEKDTRFMAGDRTLLDSIGEMKLPGGMYCHALGQEADIMATEQVLLALVSLERFRSGGARIYDFTNHAVPGNPDLNPVEHFGTDSLRFVVFGVIVMAAGAASLWIVKKHKKERAHAGTDK